MADLQPALRPSEGTAGQRVLVLANAYQVTKLGDFNVLHYDVTILPEVPARVNRQVFAQMSKLNLFGGVAVVYDGNKNIYAPRRLPVEEASAEIFLPDSDREPRPGVQPRGRTFNVSIQPVAQVNLHELGLFLNGETSSSSNVLMAINALNVMIRHGPALAFASKGQSFYPPPKGNDRPYELSGGLEMWGGYFTSIRPTPRKLIVNIDRTAMAFIQAGDLVQVATRFMRMRDPSDLARAMDRSRLQLERFCKGLQISTRSLTAGDGKKTQVKKFKIRALSKVPASHYMFENDQGQEVSLQAYFQQTYNYTLRFPNLPCVQVTKKAWYPMELCTVERGNKYTKKLLPDQVAEALKFTTQPPNRRQQLIREGLSYLGLGQSPLLRDWDFSMQQVPTQVKARVLEPPLMAFANRRGGGEALTKPLDGAWDIRGKSATGKTKFLRWIVVVFTEERGTGGRDFGFPLQACQQSVTNFAQACRDWGIQIGTNQPSIFYAGDTMDVRGAFIRASQQAGYSPQQPPELILTYVSQKNSRQYPVIKQIGDISLGVATQNLVIAKVKTAKQQYYQNVALKVNVKLNGVNQVIKAGLAPTFDKIPTIIFGADVGHPGPGSAAPSIAALVASHDLQGLQYSTQARVQPNRQEIIQDLEGMSIALIKKFYKQTKAKPARIVFYRDGVSEGQYAEVCRLEIRALKKACATIDPSYNPPITYIICAKRHHMRFFPATQDGGDRSGNVRAGTVVDKDVVHPAHFDFYLMSHGGLLGTSRPCHYQVLLDENKMSPDVIQQLTYNLAYIYPRSTRSVSIVSPAYFAHHVATRARAHIGGDDGDDQSVSFSELSSGREAAIRDQKLQAARDKLRSVHTNLENTMYFM